METRSNASSMVSQSGVTPNTDVLYLILDDAVRCYAGELQYQSRQAALLVYAQVDRLWCQVAQGILFRHVFLRKRSKMISFLRIVTPSTSRGRFLASFVRSVTVKLCRRPETSMHDAIDFIHPRHLSTLLAHLPSLPTLDLKMGEDPWTKADLAALSGRMSCRTIRMTSNKPFDQIFIPTEPNPWRHIQSLSLRYTSNSQPEFRLSGHAPPLFSLVHFECGGFLRKGRDELLWLLGNSHRTLRHCAIQVSPLSAELALILRPHVALIESLTLHGIRWDASFSSFIQTFPKLRELRIMSVLIALDFPGVLPASLEHWTVPLPLLGDSLRGYPRKINIPDGLKTYTRIRDHGNDDWDAVFSEACRARGVQVNDRALTRWPSWDTSEPKIPVPLIPPAPELMSLTSVDFDLEGLTTVYSHKLQPARTLNI